MSTTETHDYTGFCLIENDQLIPIYENDTILVYPPCNHVFKPIAYKVVFKEVYWYLECLEENAPIDDIIPLHNIMINWSKGMLSLYKYVKEKLTFFHFILI